MTADELKEIRARVPLRLSDAEDVTTLLNEYDFLPDRIQGKNSRIASLLRQLGDTQNALNDAVGIPAFMRKSMHLPPAMTIKPEAAEVLSRVEVHLQAIQAVLGKLHPGGAQKVTCCKSICCEPEGHCLCDTDARCMTCNLCERHCECSLHDPVK